MPDSWKVDLVGKRGVLIKLNCRSDSKTRPSSAKAQTANTGK
jgi:hypothetical protein